MNVANENDGCSLIGGYDLKARGAEQPRWLGNNVGDVLFFW